MTSTVVLGLAPAVAHGAGTVSLALSNGIVTATGDTAANGITIDYEPAVSGGAPARYVISGFTTGGSATNVTGACTTVSVTSRYCPTSSVSGFTLTMGDGDDTVNLRDEESGRGILIPDPMTVNLGTGTDRLSTSGLVPSSGGGFTFRIASWSTPITANGNDGDDEIFGTAAADKISGSNGNDILTAGSGDDSSVSGGAGDDTLSGGEGIDSLSGGSGNDTVNGGNGNDTISGNSGNDTLIGEGGDDTLSPGTETDTVDGGEGTDTVSYVTPVFFCFFGGCDDPPPPTAVAVSLDGVANDGGPGENDNVGPGVENIIGGDAGDTLIGDDGPNVISGGAGNDVLQGNGGNDTLDGGSGDDNLNGGDGDDTVSGVAGNDTLRGGAGADVVDGGEDSDNVGGGPGPDDLRDGGTAGADTIDYGDAATPVKVDLGGGAGMGPAEDPDALAPGFEHAVGGASNDDLNGSAGDNVLSGGAGNDVVDGIGGNDALNGGDGNDRLDGGDGADTLLGEAGADRLEGGAGSDPKLDGGDGPDVLTGGPGGTSDADLLTGGQGRDLLTYQSRTSGVIVTLDNVANDGGPNEKDNAQADIEGIFGGAGADTLRLNVPVRLRLIARPIIAPLVRPVLFTSLFRPTTTTIAPRARAAVLGDLGKVVEPGRIVQGGDGNDSIIGTAGNDVVSGGAGRDSIKLLGGNDAGYGGSGDDNLDGGDGNNRLYGNEGSDLILAGIGEDFINAADRRGADRVVCGEGRDTFLRDALDLIRKGSSCDRSIGIPKGTPGSSTPPPPTPGETPPPGGDPPPPVENTFDAGDVCGDDGDGDCSAVPPGAVDENGNPISFEQEWTFGFGSDEFDSFGAENEFDFLGYDDSFGEFDNPKELAGAVMKIKNKGLKAAVAKKGRDRNAFKLKLECPKAATRRCVGEMTVTLTPKPKKGQKAKSRELGSELFRTSKGKTANLRFKLSKKLRNLIPKGKKGAAVRVLVEARDGGDLLFGIDEKVKITR